MPLHVVSDEISQGRLVKLNLLENPRLEYVLHAFLAQGQQTRTGGVLDAGYAHEAFAELACARPVFLAAQWTLRWSWALFREKRNA